MGRGHGTSPGTPRRWTPPDRGACTGVAGASLAVIELLIALAGATPGTVPPGGVRGVGRPVFAETDRGTTDQDRTMNTNWIKWHAAELAAATVPTVAGVVVSPWWLIVSGVVVAQWVRHELTNRPDPCPSPPAADGGQCELTERPA